MANPKKPDEVLTTDEDPNVRLSVSDMQADAQGVPRPARQSFPSPGGTTALSPAKAKATEYPRMKVRAIADGYYDDVLRRPGDVFTISGEPLEAVIEREVDNLPPLSFNAVPDPARLTRRQRMQVDAQEKHRAGLDAEGHAVPAAFSSKWMERVDGRTPEHVTSHNEVLRRQHDEEVAARARTAADHNPLGA